MQENETPNEDNQAPAPKSGKFKLMLKTLLPIILIGAGIAAASYLTKTGPKSTRRTPVKLAPLVQVQPLERGTYSVVVKAMGTVVPARSVELKSRVTGEVVDTHREFTEGGLVKAGTTVVRIDPEDYKLALIQKEKAVADARYNLKLELGKQEVARKEWDLLGLAGDAKEREVELALRKPHLEKARADLTAAEAEVSKARLDLSRTEIKAPFNAMVMSKDVDLGSQVTTATIIGELAGTDAYWVMATLPVERLNWIRIPVKEGDSASAATIAYAANHQVEGRVVRLMGDLSSEGRLARVLIEVRDPLRLERGPDGDPPLLLGEYVNVHIEGRELSNVFKIPRSALRDNAFVWTVGQDSALRIKEIEPVWKDEDLVLLQDGVSPDERLVVSGLAAPVEGMPVRVEGDEEAAPKPGKPGKSGKPEKPGEKGKAGQS